MTSHAVVGPVLKCWQARIADEEPWNCRELPTKHLSLAISPSISRVMRQSIGKSHRILWDLVGGFCDCSKVSRISNCDSVEVLARSLILPGKLCFDLMSSARGHTCGNKGDHRMLRHCEASLLKIEELSPEEAAGI